MNWFIAHDLIEFNARFGRIYVFVESIDQEDSNINLKMMPLEFGQDETCYLLLVGGFSILNFLTK